MSDALDLLADAIKKASVRFRGQTMSRAQRRLVSGATHATPKSLKNVWREGGKDRFMQGGRRGRRASVSGHQAKTTPSRTQRDIAARLRIRKSEEAKMEKAKKVYPRYTHTQLLQARLGLLRRKVALLRRGAGLPPKVKKSAADVIGDFYDEVEKASGKGLIPRGK